MTIKLRAERFRIRLGAPAPAAADPAALFEPEDDGFGEGPFPTAIAPAHADPAVQAEIESVRAEALTSRQLRFARRMAARQGMNPVSDFDAVRLLRRAGIDPFQRGALLELVLPGAAPAAADADAPAAPEGTGAAPPASAPAAPSLPAAPPSATVPAPAASRALAAQAAGGEGPRLPRPVRPLPLPGAEERAEINHAAEIVQIQRDIARRRRRKSALLAARLFAFVLLPTFLCGWYFYAVATPLYATRTEFVIQQSQNPVAAGMSLGGLLQGSPLATQQDSIAVQGYLQSREAMQRLDADHGFRAAFSGPAIDPITRLDPDSTLEEAYRTYRRNIQISYDPTEGIVKLEVIAPDPALSAEFSRALIRYAEGQVDQLTQRLREDQMKGAREAYAEAEVRMIEAQRRVVELQERYKVMSSEVEISLVTAQIGQLESMLSQDRLSLEQMRANPRPNAARMEPIVRRIATLEDQIATLRAQLTEADSDGKSLAAVQGELMVAQADVQTRQLILAQSLQAMESARTEANRQVRYLSISVSPVPPDEPTYPRAFENTLVSLLIFAGIYLMVSMTLAILREQISA